MSRTLSPLRTLAASAPPALLALAMLLIPALSRGAGDAPAPPPAPVERILPNGMRVEVFPSSRLPIVHVELRVAAGVAAEVPGEEGFSRITAETLLRGTTSRDPITFQSDVARTGGQLNASVGRDYATLGGGFRSADLETAVGLLSDAVQFPLFDVREQHRVQGDALRQLAVLEQNPALAAEDELWRLAFAGHRYGRSPFGEWRSIADLDPEAMRAFWSAHYQPDAAVLAIAGDVEPARAFQIAEEAFGNWSGRAAGMPRPKAPEPAKTVRIRIVDRPGDRTELRIATLAPARGAPDQAAALAAATLYGGPPARRPAGMLTRFGREVRADYIPLAAGGLFSVALLAPTDSAAIAAAALLADLRALQQAPSSDDLAGVKRSIENASAISLETLASWTSQWLAEDYSGNAADFARGNEKVEALTPEAVAQAARTWFDPAHAVIVAVGPAARLRSSLQRLGVVEVAAPRSAPAASGPKAAVVTAAQRSQGRALVKQMIAAHGGLAKLQAIHDSEVDAVMQIELGTQRLQGTMFQMRRDPDQMTTVTNVAGNSTRQTLNRDSGWQLAAADSQARDVDAQTLEGLRTGFSSDLQHLLLTAADPATRVWAAGRQQIDSVLALAVVVQPVKGGVRTYYLDPARKLLIAFDQGEPGSQRGILARRRFSDFRRVGGILWPYHEERLLNGETVMRVDVRDLRFNTRPAASAFDKPTAGSLMPH